MTIADKLIILDAVIAQMNTYLSYASSYSDLLFDYGQSAKKHAVETLKKIDAPQYSINSIQNVSFDDCRRNMFGHNAGEYETLCANKCNAYKQSVNAVINILDQERTRLLKELQDEAQKANKRIAKWSLMFSAIAAGGTVIGLILTIFLYLCKN